MTTRNEIRTGLLVLFSLAVLVGILIYLGAPGVFHPQKSFTIYFDNGAGIKLGTPEMLAGRKVGQVEDIQSPVRVAERPPGPDGSPLPLDVKIEVRVDQRARIYKVNKVLLTSYGFVKELV